MAKVCGVGQNALMRTLWHDTLRFLDSAFRDLESAVPPPQWVRAGADMHWRYQERLIQQAMVQKLARVVSGLRAVDVLHDAGLYQEQCSMHRILDDITDDITFLAFGAVNGLDPLHDLYLEEFWKEEFDQRAPLSPPAKRGMIKRDKIRAYLNRVMAVEDSHTANLVSRIIQKTYSGYLHAASPQVMDMCGGMPPSFHLSGMKGTPLAPGRQQDAWNYFYRGLLAALATAKALGHAGAVERIYSFISEFETSSQTTYMAHAGREKPT
jgi:hypothetical protein